MRQLRLNVTAGFAAGTWRIERNLRFVLLIQMKHEFRHAARWRYSSASSRRGKFVMKVAAFVENGEKRREYKHRRNSQDQNSVAQSSDALRARSSGVVVAESAALSKRALRGNNHRGGQAACYRECFPDSIPFHSHPIPTKSYRETDTLYMWIVCMLTMRTLSGNTKIKIMIRQNTRLGTIIRNKPIFSKRRCMK